MREPTSQVRLGVLGIVAVSLFVALFARLWFLQVAAAPEFQQAAEANRIRIVQEQAPRGRILDRNGKVIVDNRVSVVVAVDRATFAELGDDEADALLVRLSDDLTRAGDPVTTDDLRERIDDQRFSPYTPVPVAQDMPEELKILIEEHEDEFPGVVVERTSVRDYPYGSVAAHVLGYVGEINDVELEERADADKPYLQGDDIGKSGVERVYEDELRGVPGVTHIEVDADGDPVRIIEERSTPPISGNDLVLTIDLDIQAVAERTLERELLAARERPVSGNNLPNEGTAGSVVVEDPRNGEVIAMASYPSYDPSAFVNGISTAKWDELNDPTNHFPLNNWAIQGQYAPGSTFKLFTAHAALSTGLRSPGFTLTDTGVYQVPRCEGDAGCVFRGGAVGLVDMRSAITRSSDSYFYDIGAQFWIQQDAYGNEAIQTSARDFGLGGKTGIPLPSEQAGRMPTPDQRAADHEANPEAFPEGEWRTGDNVNLSIGQGEVLVTPLQLSNAYSTFANGGTRFSPNIVLEVRESNSEVALRTLGPRVSGEVPLPQEVRQPILDGLVGVTVDSRGTGVGVFAGFPHALYPVAGKTGTAQVNGKADTSVFTGFGPVYDPQYTVTAILEESGFGASSAGPVVRQIFDVLSGAVPRPQVQPGGALTLPPPESDVAAAAEAATD
ncbi:MAG TPA: penicillin-binding protein 2 [Acidimicrobiales bacterium]|nr:penicillin-binding protein 2 [Acidimicrobiales bacterium]